MATTFARQLDDEPISMSVPWERLETERGRLDVQIVRSRGTFARRRLLVVEFPVELEARLLAAVRNLATT